MSTAGPSTSCGASSGVGPIRSMSSAASRADDAGTAEEQAWLGFERDASSGHSETPGRPAGGPRARLLRGLLAVRVAERLGQPLGTIKSRMFAGLARCVSSSTRRRGIVDAETHELIAGTRSTRSTDDDHAPSRAACDLGGGARGAPLLAEVAAATATATSGPTPNQNSATLSLGCPCRAAHGCPAGEGYRRSRAADRARGDLKLLPAGGGVGARDLGRPSLARPEKARAALGRQQVVTAVLSAPDARAVDLETGDGRLVVGDDGGAAPSAPESMERGQSARGD